MEQSIRIIRENKDGKVGKVLGIGLAQETPKTILEFNLKTTIEIINSYSFKQEDIIKNFIVVDINKHELHEYFLTSIKIEDMGEFLHTLCNYIAHLTPIIRTAFKEL